jgi:apolipoprotein N-acyltransferase
MKAGSNISRYKLLAAAASGLLLTLAFPKIGQPGFALVALVPLLLALRDASFPDGFRLGFITGLVHFVSLVYWAAYTMKIYGQLPLYLCVPLLVLLSAYLAIYPALFAGLVTLVRKPVLLPVFIPAFWTASEYLRAVLLTGFPWELLGYSQYRNLHFIQIADITGIYGVSFWLVLINTALFLAYSSLRRQHWQRTPVSKKTAAGAIISALAVSGILWAYGQGRITIIDREAGQAIRKKIAVVQGNIEQNKKWDRKFQKATLLKYNDLSSQAGRDKPDLIVWPETATPFFIGHNRPMTDLLVKGIRQTRTGYLIGTPTVIRHETGTAYHNSAILFDEQARIVDSYDKVHLVPYGEYVPFKEWLPFLGKMVAQVGNFIPGEKGKAIHWKEMNPGIQICYEIIFPALSRAMVQNGANLLINITNDAWFGETGAPHQHFSMAVFRAIENRRSLARAANTGISGFIDPVGRIIKTSELNTAVALTQALPIMAITTFYTVTGDLFALLCLIVTLFASGRALLGRYRKQRA